MLFFTVCSGKVAGTGDDVVADCVKQYFDLEAPSI